VATLSILLNIVVAVLLGIVIAIVLFLRRMSRSLVRRTYGCDTVHSRRARDPRQRQILNELGRQIQVLELEGALFFGTAERLTTVIDAAVSAGARYIILDLGRVTDVDSTGGRVLLQIHDDLTARGGQLLISSLNEAAHWGRTLRDLGVTTTVAHDRPFHDIDRAIDWAEEQLLVAAGGTNAATSEFPFEELDLFRGLAESERDTVRARLTLRHYQAGEVVIQEGAGGAELFIVVLGSASVYLQRHDGSAVRLVSFSAGTVFGELTLLDREPRSASVVADAELVCYVLADTAFQELKAHRPDIALELVMNLAREMTSRLRRATRTIYHLAS
jgi:anti-anti-sigma factor